MQRTNKSNNKIGMNRFIILIALLISLNINGQEQRGIFEKMPLKEALNKVKVSGRMILLDCYTSWCVPCKVMEKEEFTKQKAIEYFPKNFLCVKFDMENGEGKDIANKYGVSSYPTFLIIDSNGNEIHRVVGSSKLEVFIDKIELGLNRTTSLSVLNEKYRLGNLEKNLYKTYRTALINAGKKDDADNVLNKLWYMLTEEEKMKKEFRWIYEDKSAKLGSKYVKYLEDNIEDFKRKDLDWVSKYLYNKYIWTIDAYVYGYIKKQADYNIENLYALINKVKSWNIKNQDKLLALCALGKYRCLNDVDNIINSMKELENKLENNEFMKLLSPIHIISKNGNKKQLKQAVDVLNNVVDKISDKNKKSIFLSYLDKYKRLTNTGVLFQHITFKEALEMSKKENKLIFLDAYTKWCGPCKIMDKNIFSLESVGDILNSDFINVKFDMEEGEGKEIAKRYGISSYPTYLIIRGDGLMQYSFSGVKTKKDFIDEINKGSDELNSVNIQRIKYEAGNRTKVFLKRYAKLLFNIGHPDAYKVSKELIKYLNYREKLSKDYWFIYDKVLASKDFEDEFKFVINNLDEYYNSVGVKYVENTLSMTYRLKIIYSINYDSYKLSRRDIMKMEKEVKKLDLMDKDMLMAFFNIGKSAISNNKDLFIKTSQKESISRLSAETFPYMDLTDFALRDATEKQKGEWRGIGEKLLLQMDNGFKKSYLRGFIKKVFSNN